MPDLRTDPIAVTAEHVDRRPRRVGAAAFALVAYAAFLAAVATLVLFLSDVGVPRTVDAGGTTRPAWSAALVDIGLVTLFAVQHSAMARPWWKRRCSAFTGRSTYVLASSAALGLLMWLWHPIPDVVWRTEGATRVGVWVLFGAGWAIAVSSTFMLDHFGLFGLRQGFSRAVRDPSLRTPLLYGVVRHPIMTGFLLAFWAAPTMTVGRLLFATAMTAYVLIGTRLEESELRAELDGYAGYERATPRFVPRLRSGRG